MRPLDVLTVDDLIRDGACAEGAYAALVKAGSPTALPVAEALTRAPRDEKARVLRAAKLDGSGSGDGSGDGYGYSDGDGYGSGDGYGYGSGDGYGYGDGDGDGYGYGDGDGDGSGDGYGDGYGYGDGSGGFKFPP